MFMTSEQRNLLELVKCAIQNENMFPTLADAIA